MTNPVEQLLAKSRVTITVDGVAFVCRRITSPIAIKVLGSKALGLVRGAMRENGKHDDAEAIEIIRAYLRECMVVPRVGAESNADEGVIAFDDMGGLEPQLFAELMRESGWAEQVQDFHEPSEGGTE